MSVRVHMETSVVDCKIENDVSGAMVVAIFFLIVFVALLFGDGVITWFAMNRAIKRNQKEEALRRARIEELDQEIAQKLSDLRYLNGSFSTGLREARTLSTEFCQRFT